MALRWASFARLRGKASFGTCMQRKHVLITKVPGHTHALCIVGHHVTGARLTAYELQYDGLPATLIADSAATSLMASGKVQAVVVGADRVSANGDTANKIGTCTLATAAAAHGYA